MNEFMGIELRQVSESDGMDVYDMLQEMPLDENGFQNDAHGKTAEEYPVWLKKSVAMGQGKDLKSWQVPQNNYWLYVEGRPVGFGKLRRRLTEALMEEGGHIGYGIRPSQRGKGYGKLILKLLLEKARELGIDKAWIDCQANNELSKKVIEANGGILQKQTDLRAYYWIVLR
jgi:predicted acetyltransferase